MSVTGPDDPGIDAEVDRLIDEQRIACLWFLRPDYHPDSNEERMRALRHIERHGGLDAFRRAATLRRWLSQTSSGSSAGS
jgi:hypothetical protein